MLKVFKSPASCGAEKINLIRKALKERYAKKFGEKKLMSLSITHLLIEMKINCGRIVNLNLYSNRKNT